MKRWKLSLVSLVIASCQVAVGYAQTNIVIPGVDAEYTLGCERGIGPTANNAALVTAAMANTGYRYPYSFGAGRFDLTESIDFPTRQGLKLLGAGICKHGTETEHSVWNTIGTRLCWDGNTSDPMIDIPNCWGVTIDDMLLEGLPEGGTNRADVGIRYAPTGSAPNTSHLRLGRVGFTDMNVGVLLGTDTANKDGFTLNGQTTNHADNVTAEHLWFYNIQDACYWARGEQAVIHQIDFVHDVGGNVNVPTFWFERGGKLHVDCAEIAGNRTLLKVNKQSSDNRSFKFGYVSVDASVTDFKLVEFSAGTGDFPSFKDTPLEVYVDAFHFGGATTVPLVDVWNKYALIVIRNAANLPPGCLRICGYENTGATPDDHWTCQVVLENCTISCDNVEDLLHQDTIDDGHDYRIVWRNLWRNLATPAGGERYARLPLYHRYTVGGNDIDLPFGEYPMPEDGPTFPVWLDEGH